MVDKRTRQLAHQDRVARRKAKEAAARATLEQQQAAIMERANLRIAYAKTVSEKTGQPVSDLLRLPFDELVKAASD